MTLATGADPDLGRGYAREPISVAQLLKREGLRFTAQTKVTRRALSGIAIGAILALGTVVGSVLFNHGAMPGGGIMWAGIFDPPLGPAGGRGIQGAPADTTGSQNGAKAGTGTPAGGTGAGKVSGVSAGTTESSSPISASGDLIAGGAGSGSGGASPNAPPSSAVSTTGKPPPSSPASTSASTPAPSPTTSSSPQTGMQPPVRYTPVGHVPPTGP